MDNRRFLLFLVLSFTIMMFWNTYFQKDTPQPATVAQQGTTTAATPAADADASVPTVTSSAPTTAVTAGRPAFGGETVRVKTDVIEADISTEGGDIRRLVLVEHGDPVDAEQPYVLLKTGQQTYVAQTGLIGDKLPSHKAAFTAEQGSYTLDGKERLEVRLTHTSETVRVTKIYAFKRGSYLVDVRYEITNLSGQPLSPSAYFQIVRDNHEPPGAPAFTSTFTGPALYTEDSKFTKVDFEDVIQNEASYPKLAKDGWVAMIQHYFLSAWLPKEGLSREYYLRPLGNDLIAAGMILPVGQVAAGQTAQLSVPFYAGPQDQGLLRQLAPGLEYTVDYGWATIFADPLYRLMSFIYDQVGSWGITIILLTLLLKILFFPLAQKSYVSMAQMRKLQPKVERLKQQHGDDRMRLQQAMMELYQKEKINPLSGCLPVLVQIPVFIALYWVLLSSVEIRQAAFLWMPDLSQKDPWYILPILMGVTMFIQTKLNPKPADPMQAKVMLFMPVVFTVFFLVSPAGLVLYWTANNVLSIAQQWYVTRKIEGGAA